MQLLSIYIRICFLEEYVTTNCILKSIFRVTNCILKNILTVSKYFLLRKTFLNKCRLKILNLLHSTWNPLLIHQLPILPRVDPCAKCLQCWFTGLLDFALKGEWPYVFQYNESKIWKKTSKFQLKICTSMVRFLGF